MTAKTNILLIEDDANIRNFITNSLTGNEYKITNAFTGRDGISLAASLCPDVILLDLGLPDTDGLEVLKQIRLWGNIPIIVISARTREEEKVIALDMGADDYITKPFGAGELMARIRTSLRHSHKSVSDRIYQAKNLEINFEKRLIKRKGVEIHLTQIEYQLLTLLAKHSGKVLTYHSIMNTIWGPYMDGNNQILRVNMANIRRKIEDNPAQPQYIFTEIGIGYRMLENERNSR